MIKRSILFVVGCVLIGIGVLGFILPLIPGTIPFVIGIVILSRSSTTIRRLLSRLKTHFPRQYEKLHEIRVRLFGDK